MTNNCFDDWRILHFSTIPISEGGGRKKANMSAFNMDLLIV